MLHDAALSLIEHTYRAVIEPSLLPYVVAQIGEAVGGVQECLQTNSIGLLSFSMIAPRRDPAFLTQFHDYWAGKNVPDGMKQFGEALMAMPGGRVFDVRQIVDSGRFTRSDFYHEWWRPQKLGLAAITVRLATPNDTIGIYGVHKPAGADGFSSGETNLFALVAPHLARAISINDLVGSLAIKRGLPEAKPGKGILLVSGAGRLVFAGRRAEAWLRSGHGLRLDGGVVTASDADAAPTLARLIASCSDTGIGDAGPGGTLYAPHPGGPALNVTVAPFRPPENESAWHLFGFPRPAAILVACDPAREREERKGRLQRDYGLTAAEAEFTIEILMGDGREAAAARLGISLSTARTHLMRIFDKTGCRRQAELVRMLADRSP